MNRKEIFQLEASIAERAEKMGILKFDRLSLMMDIDFFMEQTKLDLIGLLVAEDFDFCHDIMGIQNNIDRRVPKIINCFLPRFSR